jgi:tetratricopeptide (TPR) repeat protein
VPLNQSIIAEIERALALYFQGDVEAAATIGWPLVARSRQTPHAAMVHRLVAEFLCERGSYSEAHELAGEAHTIARANHNPAELLAATVLLLRCELYQGQVTAVFDKLERMHKLAPDQLPIAFLRGLLMVLIGTFDPAQEVLERTRGALDDVGGPGQHPDLDLFRATLLLTMGKLHLLQQRFDDASAALERVDAYDLPTPVPAVLATALWGLCLTQSGHQKRGQILLSQAMSSGKKLSAHIHGHALAAAGLALCHRGETQAAVDYLKRAVSLIVHPLERQEGFYALGTLALANNRSDEASAAFRRACEPTGETYFGRLATRKLHEIVGLRVLS